MSCLLPTQISQLLQAMNQLISVNYKFPSLGDSVIAAQNGTEALHYRVLFAVQ